MLMDDPRGALMALKAEMQKEGRVKTRTSLEIGDIVYQNMDRADGLVLNNGYNERLKYFVIVGKNSKGDAIGLCLINSDLDFYKDEPIMQQFQYILKADNYKGILVKESRLDCAKLFPMKSRKSIAVKAKIVGHLTKEDESKVIPLVASCGFIDAHMKKVFRIGL